METRKKTQTLHYPYVHTTLIDFPLTLIHGITYTCNNLIEFKPNFYNIKKNQQNNMIKPLFRIIYL